MNQTTPRVEGSKKEIKPTPKGEGEVRKRVVVESLEKAARFYYSTCKKIATVLNGRR